MNIRSLTDAQQQLLKDALYEYDGIDVYDSDLKEKYKDGIIPLAYTKLGDEQQYEIQVNFNLNKMRYEEYINNELFFSPNHNYERTFGDFIHELKNVNFDDMISNLSEECAYREDIERKYEFLNKIVGDEEYLRALWYIKSENVSIDDVIDAKGNYNKDTIDNYYLNHNEPTQDTWSNYLLSIGSDVGGLQDFINSLNKSKDGKDVVKENIKSKPLNK